MSSKRSHTSSPPSDDDMLSDPGPSNRARADVRESSMEYPLRVYIISAKLAPDTLHDLASLVEKCHGNKPNLELTADANHADVVVTAVRTRPRLERHVRWEVAKTKAIVSPGWLRDSVASKLIQPCGKYAALADLAHETENPRSTPAQTRRPLSFTDTEGSVKDADLALLDFRSQLSCQRSSPLTCPNQALVQELDVIRRARFFEGEERSMLSYARAIATIKACPFRINDQTSREDIKNLPYLGTKLATMIEEFIETDKISEAQAFLSSERFLSLSAFTSVHGIGPNTARHLYSLGLRTMEDLEKYYEVTPGITHEGRAGDSPTKEIGVDKSIQVTLALRHDLSQKIPRQQVEEINHIILRELEAIDAGYWTMVTGGYRRGKLESNDVDVVVTHADWDCGADKVRGLSKTLLQRLYQRGFVKHVLNMSGHHPPNALRTHHWDSLEKALTVCALPSDDSGSGGTPRHVRVDLIFATPGVFWTAVVGWTGSTMFERDLRLRAKKKGLKFDSSGITRRHDAKTFYPTSERDVFTLLDLTYVHPTLRNADAL